MRFAEPFMGSDTCFGYDIGAEFQKYFFEFEILLNWCWFLMFSENSFESIMIFKCFEAPYKTAKILSVKGSMNKVSIFVNHLQNETSQNQRGVTHQINHTVRIFYNHSTFPMRLLREILQFQYLLSSKEMWYLNGSPL
jgi:hypothetical protein